MGQAPGAGNSLIVGAFHNALLRQGGLIFLVVILLLVGWNALRSLQYRRAVLRGEPYPGPRPVTPIEPLARRVLRLGLGALWIVDGLLQLQPQMPLGLPSAVLQPAAATSPGWVQGLVGFGVTAWSRHPAEAAAAAVWIQLGIGILLVVAPHGRWSRAAGLLSVGWGVVVWIFGEAFGGLFAPGLTFLFGAPGGVLFYAVGGGLLALPDRSWATRQVGRVITSSVGAFLVVMAVLQAWPGRGFWEGTAAGRPGTLAAMVSAMATTPQPHVLASMVSAFGSFDEAHVWVVNLFTVVALAAIGGGLLWGRRLLYPALIALVVVGVADWVFIEDFGVWGGTGTDPNSMVPLLLLAVCGYLAMVRVPVDVPAALPAEVPATATAGDGTRAAGGQAYPEVVAGQGRAWWEKIDPGYAGRLAAALGAVVIVLIGTAPMVAAAADPDADTLLAESVNGTPTVINGPAPQFDLVDQRGRPVSLGSLRGQTVALTFLDPVCTTDCPIIAQEFRVADQMLGAQAGNVRFVAIDANPEYNSLGAVDAFDRQEGLATEPNWLFLTGSVSALRPVWNAYGASVAPSPAGGMAVHADLAYIIDSAGHIRRVLNADPGAGTSADQSSFSTVLTEQISQVLRA